MTIELDTLDPELPPPPPPPTPPPPPPPPPPPVNGDPDLVITAFDATSYTVLNRGKGSAGPFMVRMGTFSERFQGLGPGQSVKRFYAKDCASGDRTVVADADKEVKETDETNNSKFGSFLC